MFVELVNVLFVLRKYRNWKVFDNCLLILDFFLKNVLWSIFLYFKNVFVVSVEMDGLRVLSFVRVWK